MRLGRGDDADAKYSASSSSSAAAGGSGQGAKGGKAKGSYKDLMGVEPGTQARARDAWAPPWRCSTAVACMQAGREPVPVREWTRTPYTLRRRQGCAAFVQYSSHACMEHAHAWMPAVDASSGWMGAWPSSLHRAVYAAGTAQYRVWGRQANPTRAAPTRATTLITLIIVMDGWMGGWVHNFLPCCARVQVMFAGDVSSTPPKADKVLGMFKQGGRIKASSGERSAGDPSLLQRSREEGGGRAGPGRAGPGVEGQGVEVKGVQSVPRHAAAWMQARRAAEAMAAGGAQHACISVRMLMHVTPMHVAECGCGCGAGRGAGGRRDDQSLTAAAGLERPVSRVCGRGGGACQ